MHFANYKNVNIIKLKKFKLEIYNQYILPKVYKNIKTDFYYKILLFNLNLL